MSDIKLIHGDCLIEMAKMPEKSVDAIICDPPYGLEFMGKDWDSFNSGRTRQENEVTAISRGPEAYKAGKPFQQWTQAWAIEALRVLKPGGYLLAFGGTRTSHRLVCGLEDAGFVIRDTLCWLYGSGFPKSLNIGKMFDKRAGVEREVVEGSLTKTGIAGGTGKHCGNAGSYRYKKTFELSHPATDLAKTWDGYGTGLKPAHEPIILAQKPLEGTYCQNIEKWEVGALNIDKTRINISENQDKKHRASAWSNHKKSKTFHGETYKNMKEISLPVGRFPTNLILDEEAAQMLDEQSGVLKSGFMKAGTPYPGGTVYRKQSGSTHRDTIADVGGASRFFYIAKASRAERGNGNSHPCVKPIALLMCLAKLVLPHHKSVIWLDPFVGSGSSALAASKLNDEEGYQISFIGIDQEEKYLEIAKQRLKEYNKCVQLRIPICPSEPV